MRKQFAALSDDDIHEDTDLSVLRKVVHKRVKGLSIEESRTVLTADAAELKTWLGNADETSKRLFFILPILPDGREILLTKQPESPPERGEANMELPKGAKLNIENGGWAVTWRRMLLSLSPSHCEEMHREAGQCRGNAKAQPMIDNDGVSIADIRFGEAMGIKCVYKSKSRGLKSVWYALDVPGGYIVATVQSTARDFDESGFEKHFHTLHVTNYPPPPKGPDVT